MAIYTKVGGYNTVIGIESPGDNYRLMETVKPDGFYICEAIDEDTGQWVEGMTTTQAKLEGFTYSGVTGNGKDGMSAMYILINLKGESTTFHFENGNTIDLNPSNFDAFDTAWTDYRQSFF